MPARATSEPHGNGTSHRWATAIGLRIVALGEVLLVLALVHVSYRLFRRHTEWGAIEGSRDWVFSMGAIMTAAAGVLVAARVWGGKRSWGSYGFALKPIGERGGPGVAFFFIVAVAGILARGLGWRTQLGNDLTLAQGAQMSTLGLGVAVLFFGVWRYKPQWIRPKGWGTTTLLVLMFLGLPIAVALYKGRMVEPLLFHVGWRFVAAGFGEEIFFRGYMQSRLNEAWGTPWKLLGVRFGWGLILTAVIFGFVHVMNPVDYLSGRYDFAWGHLLACFVFPYGWLREKTGSILAPALLHGLVDVAVLVPRVLG